ncbi:TetR family transcriptional regulator [Streptomyces olivaceoviridis]
MPVTVTNMFVANKFGTNVFVTGHAGAPFVER